ncbi:hypothetical protein GCM10009122_40690 [Fulvivirga kasyanovii]|uniref:Uncharacterized protein n=1 Tax=Fulvivirga kasyanovii TaxID=396812 RepID=A0ABW9RXB3_9BACT|nr:hypothetical protein [Fulvivirga kasyanovii]MTI28317.1 hypothetical protein [Fulvivirga kasyanovii]
MHRFTLLLFSLIIFNAHAQNGRFIQQIDLNAEENAPFFSRVYSLPELAIEAVRAGKVHAYDVDYSTNKLTALNPHEFRSRLIMSVEDYGFGSVDTIFFTEGDFTALEIDVSKKGNKIAGINFLHFRVKEAPNPGKHEFTVSFAELSDYLNQKKALWVRNSTPWLWKGQIVHTNGDFASNIVYDMFPDANYSYIHLLKGKDGDYAKLQVYDRNHKLAVEQPFEDASSDSKIKLMTSALLQGDYQMRAEKKLKTNIEESSTPDYLLAPDQNFFVIQHEEIHLTHPENAKFYMEEKELPTLIMAAIESGEISRVYKDNLLTDQMTTEEWLYNTSEEVMYLSDDRETEYDETSEDNFEIQRVMYSGRSANIVSVSWKKYFNNKGEVIAQMPHSIGLFIGPEQTLTGLSKLLGYFSFNDVYHALKDSPKAYYQTSESGNFINDLMKRDYFSYFTSTSGISIESR